MHRLLPLLVMLAIGAAVACAYSIGRQRGGDVTGLTKKIESVAGEQAAMRKDLAEMRDLLKRQPAAAAPREIVLTLEGAPFKGDANAKLTLVEFTDYECGFCGRHVRDTIPQLERDYISTGKVKYVFRNFPLESIHKKAFKAHEAAVCAGEQGKFWEMHDRLFADQAALMPGQLSEHANALGLSMAEFDACLAAGRQAERVRKDLAEGQKAGVTATPAFFLGITTPNSPTLKVVKTIKGAKAYPAFKEEIDALLAAAASPDAVTKSQ